MNNRERRAAELAAARRRSDILGALGCVAMCVLFVTIVVVAGVR